MTATEYGVIERHGSNRDDIWIVKACAVTSKQDLLLQEVLFCLQAGLKGDKI